MYISCFIGVSLVPAMCNHTLYAQSHDFLQSHCVLWIIYEHLYYAIFLSYWALLAHYYQSCATVNHFSSCINCQGTLFSWLHIHFARLALSTSEFEQSLCRGPLIKSLLLICTYIYIYKGTERIITYIHINIKQTIITKKS